MRTLTGSEFSYVMLMELKKKKRKKNYYTSMGVNKDNGVRTSSMMGGGGSSRIKVIEAAGMAARYRWHTGAIAV